MGTLPSGLPEKVHDDEDLARFLTSSSQFNATMVKPSVFLPNPKNHELSVFRHGSVPPEALWKLAENNLGARTLYGAAILKAQAVRAAQLEVQAKEPPLRHANIIGWPWPADPEMAKAEQKERATLIAQHATLVKR